MSLPVEIANLYTSSQRPGQQRSNTLFTLINVFYGLCNLVHPFICKKQSIIFQCNFFAFFLKMGFCERTVQRQENKCKLRGFHLLRPACYLKLTERLELKAQLLSQWFMVKVCGQIEGRTKSIDYNGL